MPNDAMTYEIRLKGHLDAQWTDWFEGMTITLEDNGDTLLSGVIVDQAALHGIFRRALNLGLAIISVLPAEEDRNDKEEDET